MLLDHLPATNLNMFAHLLTNKETSILTDYLEFLTTYLQLFSFFNIKTQLINFLWQHSMKNFNADDLHSLHFLQHLFGSPQATKL